MTQAASWKHILALLSLLGIFGTGTIFGVLFWLTAQIDQIEFEKTRALIELKLFGSQEMLKLSTENYAYWTLAYDLIESGDSSSILDNIGSGATDSNLFDQLFIVSAGGDLLHAFDEVLGAKGHEQFDEVNFRPVWVALNDITAQTYQSVGSIVERDGEFSFVVAAWVTPDNVAMRPDAQFPAIFGLIHLDEDWLYGLTNDAQVGAVHLSKFASDGTYDPLDDSLMLHDVNGAPLAELGWSALSTGAELRKELLPSVLWIEFGILAICGLSARYFYSLHKALEKAKQVATTDQLTGLLNRAGLVEKLGQKDIARSLEQGHVAAIYVDLNKFKKLNDTLGHQAGDIALRVTAQRLQSAVRQSDVVTRLGGDEFVCLIVDADPDGVSLVVAQRIIDLAAAPISFEGHDQIVMPAVGLAVASPGTRWETLLSRSDAAMFWSKQTKANYPVVFCKSMDLSNINRQTTA